MQLLRYVSHWLLRHGEQFSANRRLLLHRLLGSTVLLDVLLRVALPARSFYVPGTAPLVPAKQRAAEDPRAPSNWAWGSSSCTPPRQGTPGTLRNTLWHLEHSWAPPKYCLQDAAPGFETTRLGAWTQSFSGSVLSLLSSGSSSCSGRAPETARAHFRSQRTRSGTRPCGRRSTPCSRSASRRSRRGSRSCPRPGAASPPAVTADNAPCGLRLDP